MKRILIFIIIVNYAYTQSLPDELFSQFEFEEIDESQLEYLYDLLESPLNLNQCSYDELIQLHFLDVKTVQAILNYRKNKVYFTSVYELQAIQDLDRSKINLLLHFVEVSPIETNIKTVTHQIITLYQSQFEKQLEYTDGTYLGSKHKHLLRYKSTFKNVTLGLLTEKDLGENWFDFNSFHFTYGFKNSKLFLGDFQLSLGQGISYFQGFGFGKSSEVLNTFKKNPTIRVHSSSRESHFMRGFAYEHVLNKWKMTSWYSANHIDGSYDETTKLVTSLQDFGLHRTEGELENKNQILEKQLGAKIGYTKNKVTSSAYFIAKEWDKSLVILEDTLKKSFNLGADYSFTYQNAHLFGEVNYVNQSLSAISAITLNLSNQLAIAMLYRSFSEQHHSWESNAFGEQSTNRNEKGLYTGLQLIPSRKWEFSFYADYFEFPTLSYYTSVRQRGAEYFLELKHESSKRFHVFWRIQYENKLKDITDYIGLKSNHEISHLKLLSQLDYKWQELKFKSRIAVNHVDNQWGYLIFQDMNYKSLESKWGLVLRYMLFDTPNFSSRIYTYEPDVLYAFSVPSFYGQGQKSVIVFKYKFSRNWMFNFKFSQIYFFDNTPIRSGSVNGNKLTEYKLLVKCNF